jgi:ABC-2 type transport system permease protein
MLPALPIGFAFFGIGNPDSIGMRILSIFPLTSPGLLPVRLVLADVAWWEVMLATLLLCLCVWFLRIAAGRIFHLGMLIQGKEPSLKEVLRWAKKA